MTTRTDVLIDGLAFPEGPRWHQAKLWLSDMHAHRVITVDADGKVEEVCDVPGQPSGLGWLPDGRLLVVSMTDRRLLRREPNGSLQTAADLGAIATFHCNDMVVDSQGRAYIGNFGFDFHAQAPFQHAKLALVLPDGTTRVVADELSFPNGTVITPDGRTLIVGESFAARLTAFDILADGALAHRRVWAQLDSGTPDGICLDAEDGIWVASPLTNEVLRVVEGGEITQRFPLDRQVYACMLGGADRRTLFLCTGTTLDPDEARARRSGRIETIRVDVPGAGLP